MVLRQAVICSRGVIAASQLDAALSRVVALRHDMPYIPGYLLCHPVTSPMARITGTDNTLVFTHQYVEELDAQYKQCTNRYSSIYPIVCLVHLPEFETVSAAQGQ